MSVSIAETSLHELLGLSKEDSRQTPSFATSNIRFLHHFQTSTSLTLGSSLVQRAMHFYVGQKAWSQRYMMYMVLAVASTHLKRLVASSQLSYVSQELSLAEALHWEAGLQHYRSALGSPRRAGNETKDALIGTTFLAVICAFALGDLTSPDAYLVDFVKAVSNALGPLAAASGIIALRFALNVFDTSAAWTEVILASDDRDRTFTCQDPGTAGLPPAFIELCGLDDTSTADNNEYQTIVRYLTPLLALELRAENFVKFIAFGGRTFVEFRPLLHRGDTKALLLLSYWFAMLSRLDQWWLTERARSECLAITTYLSSVPDPSIQALLPFPLSFGEERFPF
ncbi:hypothetical protein MMC11_008909 [Xylographa trunciseda]|nr:hypothetical protein [Xylographa trunciseda]